MKTPEEWLKEWSFFEKIPTRELSAIIKETQKEAWNEALDWAVQNARAHGWYDDFDGTLEVEVYKESILKGKI
ncbi:MAG: hypothetical protein LLG05_11625 [Porphyromonadaceae bacterium]|nr:hypothetical protein [Porphyromonadaceae bacterium]